jgi:hypothetical protein
VNGPAPTSPDPPLFHPSNISGSPASSMAGVAAILSVLSGALNHGVPTTAAGWFGVFLTVLSGVGAMFARA